MGVYTGVRGSALLEGTDFAFNEAVDASACTGSILELAVDCERNNMRMFESVIEMDFLEAASLLEADIPWSAADKEFEAAKAGKQNTTKQSIWKKIKELVKTAIRKIKEFIANFIGKIKNLFANDQKLYATYIKYWKPENLKGFKVTDYTPIDALINPEDMFEGVSIGTVDKMMEVIDKCGTKEDIAKFSPKDHFSEFIKDFGEGSYRELANKTIFGKTISGETEFVSIPNQVNMIATYVKDAKFYIDNAKKLEKLATSVLNRSAKEIKYSKNDNMGDLEVAKINAQYKAVSYVSSQMSKLCSAYTGATGSALARARRVFITGGKYAKSKAEGKSTEATKESAAFDAMLEISSDAYVESVLYEF